MASPYDFTGLQIDLDKLLAYLEGYLTAFAVFLASIVALKIFKSVVVGRLRRISKKTKTEYDDLVVAIVDHIGWPFYVIVSVYLASHFAAIPAFVDLIIYYLLVVAFTFYAIRCIQEVIEFTARRLIERRKQEEKDADTSVIHLLAQLSKGLLWGVAVILILANLGYDISALIAGLGIGGIAIAFALQNVLSDIFASFSIYFDKPFRVGDFIIVGSDMGEVKKIGIQSTRLQSLWGQEVVISNKELVSSRINNYKKMKKRRVHFKFGVVYETPAEKIRKALDIVRDIFAKIEGADLDRVHFKDFGDFSLNFEVAYYVGTGDYNKYMDVQQEINLALKERFEKEGIVFAYPTQTVYVNKGS